MTKLKNKNKFNSIIFVLIFSLVAVAGNLNAAPARAGDSAIVASVKAAKLGKGFVVSNNSVSFKLALPPGSLKADTDVEIKPINDPYDYPWEWEKISPITQFDLKNSKAYDSKKPLTIELRYDKSDNGLKRIFFFDKGKGIWKALATKDFPDKKIVRAQIALPFARVAVFSNADIMTVGKASWYSYKKGLYAASPDFPTGSILRIHLLNSKIDKFVDVEVNDHGPDRKVHPDRVVDLTKEAFKKIAALGAGTASVYVEPIKITGQLSAKLKTYELGVASTPEKAFRAAVAMDENTGNIIQAQNADAVLPLASLSKMVAIKVFLEVHSSTTEVVAYSKADEEYNYQYCKPWESGKLALEEGETLTINDLLYSSLVGSTNNTVETLVRVSGLTRPDFIQRMNDLVKSYGAQTTFFEEPTGLSPKNVSSAKDYAIIVREVLKEPLIEAASSATNYKFSTISKNKAHNILNTNQLVRNGKFTITGSKTGYLDESKYNLMTRVKGGNGLSLIVVTFGADTRASSFQKTEEYIRQSLKIVSTQTSKSLALK